MVEEETTFQMLKVLILMWMLLNNKVLAWDMLQKRTFESLGKCNLFQIQEEINYQKVIFRPQSNSFSK